MQSQLDSKTIHFWKYEAESEIMVWGKKILNDVNELFNVPNYLLDRNPDLNDYKIAIIKNITNHNISIEKVDIYYDRLFLDHNNFGKSISDIGKIYRLAEKYDFGAIISIADYVLFEDKHFIYKAIKLFKNKQQLEYNLKYHEIFKKTITCDEELTLTCLQISPRSVITISKTYFKDTYNFGILDLDTLISQYFEIALTNISDLFSYEDNLLFLPCEDEYLLPDNEDNFYFLTEKDQNLLLVQNEANPKLLKYNQTLCRKVAQLNPLAFLYIKKNALNSDNVSYQDHFLKLVIDTNDYLSEEGMLSENKLSHMNEHFFHSSKEHRKKLLDKAQNYLPNLFFYLAKIQYRKNLFDLQKAKDLSFHYG